jgi:hypothetical protein
MTSDRAFSAFSMMRTALHLGFVAIFASMLAGQGIAKGSASVSLTAQQIVEFQNQLDSVIKAVTSQSFGGSKEKGEALAAAINRATIDEIAKVGPTAAGAVSSTVIAVGASDNVTAFDIGEGLGKTAMAISACGGKDSAACETAKSIARTVANEGTSDMIAGFEAAITAAGGSSELSAALKVAPEVTAVIPGTVSGQTVFGTFAPPIPPPAACNNPSCT